MELGYARNSEEEYGRHLDYSSSSLNVVVKAMFQHSFAFFSKDLRQVNMVIVGSVLTVYGSKKRNKNICSCVTGLH